MCSGIALDVAFIKSKDGLFKLIEFVSYVFKVEIFSCICMFIHLKIIRDEITEIRLGRGSTYPEKSCYICVLIKRMQFRFSNLYPGILFNENIRFQITSNQHSNVTNM